MFVVYPGQYETKCSVTVAQSATWSPFIMEVSRLTLGKTSDSTPPLVVSVGIAGVVVSSDVDCEVISDVSSPNPVIDLVVELKMGDDV